MAKFFEGLPGAARDNLCPLLDKYWQLFDTQGLPALDYFGNYRRFGNWITRALCNRPPNGNDPYGPQTCFRKRYRIDYRVDWRDLDETTPVNFSSTSFIEVWGPIRGYVWIPTGQPDRGPIGLFCNHGNGLSAEGIQQTQMYGNSSPGDGDFRFTILAVTDLTPTATCTGPLIDPRVPFMPSDWRVENNYTYETNEGPSFTIPLIFAYGQLDVNINGEISIPVNITPKVDLNINPSFNFPIDIDIPIGGGPPVLRPRVPPPVDPGPPALPPSPRPDDFEPSPPPATKPPDVPDPDDPASPEPEQICSIRAAIVTTTAVSPTSSPTIIGQDGNPDIYAPSLGYINFAYRVSGNAIAWGPDVPIKNRRQFCEVTWPAGAVDVKGTPKPGISWSISPVWECRDA